MVQELNDEELIQAARKLVKNKSGPSASMIRELCDRLWKHMEESKPRRMTWADAWALLDLRRPKNSS